MEVVILTTFGHKLVTKFKNFSSIYCRMAGWEWRQGLQGGCPLTAHEDFLKPEVYHSKVPNQGRLDSFAGG